MIAILGAILIDFWTGRYWLSKKQIEMKLKRTIDCKTRRKKNRSDRKDDSRLLYLQEFLLLLR